MENEERKNTELPEEEDPTPAVEETAGCRESEDVARNQDTSSENRGTYYSQPPKKPKSSGNTGLIVALSLVCVLCVLALVGVFTAVVFGDFDIPVLNGDADPDGSSDKAPDLNSPDAENPDLGGLIPKDDPDQETENPNEDEAQTAGNPDVSIDISDTDGKDRLSYGEVYEKCAPAAVGIEVTVRYTSYGREYEQKGVGSGFIIDPEGYIVTNAHVVSGTNTIVAYLPDGNEYTAELIGCDDLSDLAVIKINADSELPTVEFGDSSNLKVGDIVTAIGTPADISLAGTFTQGIISAVDRSVELTDDYGITKTMKLLQTDATINPGNSGGPLLNMYGQVIGINTLKLTEEFEGIGFAIPSVYAEKVVEEIIRTGGNISFDPDNGYVTVDETPNMGIAECRTVTESMSILYGWPRGVQIFSLEKNCSLAKQGVASGDIITEFNGVAITTVEELQAERNKVKPREEAEITIYRNGKYYTVTFTMGSNISY